MLKEALGRPGSAVHWLCDAHSLVNLIQHLHRQSTHWLFHSLKAQGPVPLNGGIFFGGKRSEQRPLVEALLVLCSHSPVSQFTHRGVLK